MFDDKRKKKRAAATPLLPLQGNLFPIFVYPFKSSVRGLIPPYTNVDRFLLYARWSFSHCLYPLTLEIFSP